MLVGGLESDTLYGGNDGDLLLGDDMAQATALLMYADWLTLGIGGVATLRTTYAPAVINDGAIGPDALYGQGGSDWFLAYLEDVVKDGKSGDVVDRNLP